MSKARNGNRKCPQRNNNKGKNPMTNTDKIRTMSKIAAQGDVIIVRIDALPDGLIPVARENGVLIVTHSETGHHHTIESAEAEMFERLDRDPLIAYLSVTGDYVDLVHQRSFDTHATWRLPPGTYRIVRQREQGVANEQIGPWAGRRAAD